MTRSRLAPSPTGALHLGNARTFLLTWLHVRAVSGTLLLRIDDLDGPRVKTGAAVQALDDLRRLGLDWDEAPGVLVQSERAAVYDAAAQRLVDSGLAYPCVCTRTEVESAASAPHGAEGPRYPGTCRGRWSSLDDAKRDTARPAALRFATTPGAVPFDDALFGAQAFDPAAETGDFVIRKSNGTAAYQLATVVDDAASGVDLVIRGADLLPSTSRQILLQRALGLPTPAHLHLPLVVGPDGRRLAKRHGDTSIRTLLASGWTPDALVGWLAWSAGLAEPGARIQPRDLIPRYNPANLSRDAVVVDASALGPRG
ncbi:MAG: tRNA glutamyl-Q(34) synthetase GluQRS [Planctomycetes bacterium]|nr:tRNA glutamyl-Q(34) synthetase GluQRS [Planctomycetota bacterium]